MGKELQRGSRSVEREACENGFSLTGRARLSRWLSKEKRFEGMLGVNN